MRVFTGNFLNELTVNAGLNHRKRLHYNVHQCYSEPCQRLFNALGLESFIHPHRHWTDPKDELLIAVRGEMAFITFANDGEIISATRFGVSRTKEALAVGLEVTPSIWHTVVALEPGCILFEMSS